MVYTQDYLLKLTVPTLLTKFTGFIKCLIKGRYFICYGQAHKIDRVIILPRNLIKLILAQILQKSSIISMNWI
jgi:hypothetical protein